MGSREQEGKRNAFCLKLFFSFVDQSIQEERYAELAHLGVSRDIVDEYEELSATARANLFKSAMRCFDFTVYDDVLRQMISDAKAKARCKKAVVECVVRGAPYDMLSRLYDLSLRDFRKIRRQKGVTKAGARGTDDPEAVTAIVEAWETRGCRFESDVMIAIDDDTGAGMKVVWSVLKEYAPQMNEPSAPLLEQLPCVEADAHV